MIGKILEFLKEYVKNIDFKKSKYKLFSNVPFIFLTLIIILLQWYYIGTDIIKSPSSDYLFVLLLLLTSLIILYIICLHISIRVHLKLFFMLIYFGIISYYLQKAIHLNDANYYSSLTETMFDYPVSILTYISILLLSSLVIRTIIESKEIQLLDIKLASENQTVILLLIVILNQNNQLVRTIINFFKVSLTLSNISVLTELFIGALFIIFLSNGLLQLIQEKNGKWVGVYTVFLSSILLSSFYNYFLQSGVRIQNITNSNTVEFMFNGALEFQTFILFVLFCLVYLIINKYLLATLVNIIVWSLVIYANISKFKQRDEPLLLTDFTWLRKFSFLLKFINLNIFLFGVLLILGIAVGYTLYLKKVDTYKIINSIKYRLVAIFTLIFLPYSLLSVSINNVSENYYFAELRNRTDFNWLGFSANSRFKSVTYLWAQQFFSPIMKKPLNYSESNVKELVNKYTQISEQYNSERTNQIFDQTVIYILSESFINPERLSSLTVSRPIVPNIMEISNANTGGTMKSDGYGGGTANMEFQSLTGLPFYIFSDSISVANTEVFPKLKYIPVLSDSYNSENRIAIHPDSATNYNRNNIYDTLEFSKFIAKRDSKDVFIKDEIVGIYPSDRSVYQTIVEELSETDNQFFSVITMQNHAPYSANDPLDIVVTGSNFTEEENNSVTNYARLLNHTDNFTKDFLNSLTEINKKITVVFYGDHLPGIFPENTFTTNPESQFETDFFIWSNFETVKKDYSTIHSSDMTAVLLDHTNSKVSPYYALLTKVAQVDINYKKQGMVKESEFLRDLELLQYDITEGEGYILNYPDFFEFK